MEKFKENVFRLFNNLYVPGILIILMSLFLGKNELWLKMFLIVCIPLLTSPLIIGKIREKEIKNEKRIKLFFLFLIFEILFISGLIFKGTPILPVFFAPFNNLYFYGILISLLLIYLSKTNKKIDGNKAFMFFLGVWIVIFIYQFLIY